MEWYWYVAIILLIINLFGFLICFEDKRRAKKKKWRIREKTFFLTALFGGGFGVWGGMYTFRHKTKHWYFVVFIPLITLVEYLGILWVTLFRR